MTFLWPAMLISLAAIPLFWTAYARAQRRRRAIAAAYGSLGMAVAAGSGQGRRRYVPAGLFLAGIALLLLGLARPQAVISLPRLEGTVILAFDVSGSMAAGDLAPTRMEAAKAAAAEFARRQPATVQIGVVAFSDSGIAVQAPTSDQAAVLAAIDRLTPQLGTSLGAGILAALNTIAVDRGETATPLGTAHAPAAPPPVADATALIVLFTDGENNGAPEPLEAAAAAAQRGIAIHTVGIGSAAGTTLEIDGFTVHTQLDEATLRQIAELTDGTYSSAEDLADLHAIYERLETQLVVKPARTEVTAIFAGAGLLLLLAGAGCSIIWLGRLP